MARLAQVDYQPLAAVLVPAQAVRLGDFVVPPLRLARGDVSRALADAPRRLAGTFSVGGQEHFYLEGQVAYAVPREDRALHLWCSTQHPSAMQTAICGLLAMASNQVVVEMRRM